MKRSRHSFYLLFFLVVFVGLIPPILHPCFSKVQEALLPPNTHDADMIGFTIQIWLYLALMLITMYWGGRKIAIDLTRDRSVVLLTILGGCIGSWIGQILIESSSIDRLVSWNSLMLASFMILDQFVLAFTMLSLIYFSSRHYLLLNAPGGDAEKQLSNRELNRRNMRILFGTVVLLVGVPLGYTELIVDVFSRFFPAKNVSFLSNVLEGFVLDWGHIGLIFLGAYWLGRKYVPDLRVNLRVVTLILLGGIIVGLIWVQVLNWALSLGRVIRYKIVWSELLFLFLLLLNSFGSRSFFLLFTGVSMAHLKFCAQLLSDSDR